jgi:hypothetical protein
MKRLLIILVSLLGLTALLPAQAPSQRMKAVHMTAVRIADHIGLQEPARAEFIQLYQAFKKESATLLGDKAAVTGDAEKDAEAKIHGDFAKSEKLLALRKAYYEKFRKILKPSQIQAMYDLEKEFNARK